MKKRLYLFDFDGTLTKRDSLFDFLKKTQNNYTIGFIIFIPLFIIAKLKIVDPGKIKEKFISFFLKGKTRDEIEKLSIYYFKNSGDLLHESAKKYLENIKDYPDKYIVSASLDFWLKPFAEYYNFKLICTKSKFINDKFTGRYEGENNNNTQKKQRIINEIDLSKYEEIYAFGDTSGDKEMISLATHPHYQFFGKGL